jgi:hypothetical protein
MRNSGWEQMIIKLLVGYNVSTVFLKYEYITCSHFLYTNLKDLNKQFRQITKSGHFDQQNLKSYLKMKYTEKARLTLVLWIEQAKDWHNYANSWKTDQDLHKPVCNEIVDVITFKFSTQQ